MFSLYLGLYELLLKLLCATLFGITLAFCLLLLICIIIYSYFCVHSGFFVTHLVPFF